MNAATFAPLTARLENWLSPCYSLSFVDPNATCQVSVTPIALLCLSKTCAVVLASTLFGCQEPEETAISLAEAMVHLLELDVVNPDEVQSPIVDPAD